MQAFTCFLKGVSKWETVGCLSLVSGKLKWKYLQRVCTNVPSLWGPPASLIFFSWTYYVLKSVAFLGCFLTILDKLLEEKILQPGHR